ncbi:MAG: VWA domain-containing protein [Chloracidobacterium sp.]|nr:VWA domain-containing protein [Chloracidobacterium sp.]
MKITSLLTITTALFLLFVAGGENYAQQANIQKPSVTINTDLVVTWAQVLDRKDGKGVTGLGVDDFVLREDGKTQQISLLKEGQPNSVVILIPPLVPCSGVKLLPEYSFRRNREALRQLGDDAEIALMVWDYDIALAQPMTMDHNLIADKLEDRSKLINALRPRAMTSEGDLAEFARPGEAIYQAARYLQKTASSGRRKIIIVIANASWLDKWHRRAAVEVREMLEKTGTTVYGLYQDFVPGDVAKFQRLNQKDKKRRSGGTIEEFVGQTGGSILVGKTEESDEMLIKLAGLIRSSYTIGYYPENSNFDGGFRTINLELSLSGKTKAGLVDIKTRSGYRAFRPSPPSPIAAAEGATDSTIRTRQKEGQPNSVVILINGLFHCCHEPLQLFTELSIQEDREALRQLGDDAEIALMAWDYDTALVQPMTRDQDLIAYRLKDKNTWINSLRPRSIYPNGDAAEFARPGEAIYRAAQYLEKNASPGRRKIIIIIGHADWLDKAHTHTAAEVKEMLEKTGTTVYGLYEDYSPNDVVTFQLLNQKDKKRRSGGTIEEFVGQTGGSILIGKPDDGDELLSKLIGLIRSKSDQPTLVD